MKKKILLSSVLLIVALSVAYVFGNVNGKDSITQLTAQPTSLLVENDTKKQEPLNSEEPTIQTVKGETSFNDWNYANSEADIPVIEAEKTVDTQTKSPSVVNLSYTQSASSDAQLIEAKVSPFSYPEITVEAGRPVRINFKVATNDDLNACNNEIIIPAYNIKKPLTVGDNFVEFTPTKEGKIPYSCWMDMIRSNIIVTASGVKQEDTQATDKAAVQQPIETAPAPQTAQADEKQNLQKEAIQKAMDEYSNQNFQKSTLSNDGNVTTINAQVAAGGYSELVVEVGKPVRINFKVEEGNLNSCNDEIIMPEWNIRKKLSVGDNFVEFTPTRAGDFIYTCWMGMIQSKVTVIEAGIGQAGALPLDESANQQRSCPMMSGSGSGGCGMMSGGLRR